jgi:hypothetical protein
MNSKTRHHSHIAVLAAALAISAATCFSQNTQATPLLQPTVTPPQPPTPGDGVGYGWGFKDFDVSMPPCSPLPPSGSAASPTPQASGTAQTLNIPRPTSVALIKPGQPQNNLHAIPKALHSPILPPPCDPPDPLCGSSNCSGDIVVGSTMAFDINYFNIDTHDSGWHSTALMQNRADGRINVGGITTNELMQTELTAEQRNGGVRRFKLFFYLQGLTANTI